MKAEMEITWDDHLKTISNLFSVLYDDSALVDVTLSCQGGFLRAHKLVLSACSPYFHQVFRENPCKHPTVVLRSVCYDDMAKLLEYMYRGTISIRTDHLEEIVHVANDLKIKGFEMYGKKMEPPPPVIEEEVREECEHEINVPEIKPIRDTKVKKRVHFQEPESDTEQEKEPPCVQEEEINVTENVSVINEEIEEDIQTKPEIPQQVEHEAPLSTSENEEDEELEDKSNNREPTEVPSSNKIVTLFECDVCGGRFKSRKDVQKHKKIHQDKSFSCEFCNKKFSRASHLIRHRRVHTGERPFICDTCGKDFARQDKLKLHIRTSHNNNIDKDINPDEIRIGTVDKKYMDDDSESEPSEHITLENLMPNTNANAGSGQKRGRGRPRKYPLLPPKRGRRHSKDDSYEDNYDITSLPYGDLSYLTMPYEQGGNVIEPLVEICTENTNPETPDENESSAKNTEPETEAKEDQVLMTIAKIGECTISLN